MNQTPTLLHTALQLHKHGISVLPVRADGSKRPAGPWKHLQTAPAPDHEIRGWFTGTDLGLGVVTGAVSGNLEMLEVEGRAAHRIVELKQLAEESGLGPLWAKVAGGWFEISPSGGYHFLYRTTTPPPGNTKLAQANNRETIAETRGEGGYTVVAPTAGTIHPTGKAWQLLAGGPTNIPTLTDEERESLHILFATLDERAPEPEQTDIDAALETSGPTRNPVDGISPGDDYEAKTDWADILTPHGWTLVTRGGRTRYWRRPGKTDPGFSATTGHADDRDRLYVFTTSTEFEQEKPYTKFGAYALLHHAGDHSAAAKQLRADGYGSQPSLEERTKERTLTLVTAETPTSQEPAGIGTDGNLATVHQLEPRPVPAIPVTLTDRGNSELLIQRHGHRLRYAPSRGKWLTWDGTRWQWQEDDGPAIEAVWETIDAITPTNDVERAHKHKSMSRRSLEAAAALARRDTRIRVTANQLDAHPYQLNTPAGTINLRTGTVTPNDPAMLHTKITLAPHVAGATAPRWEAFLTDTFGDDTELITFVQQLIGYASTGEVTHHVLPFLFGSGGNGKSVFLDVLTRILGDYATSAPAGFLMAGQQQHETEVARLAGIRVAVCSEVNQEAKFDEERVKLLTGGDQLTARFMRQDHFTFTPTHTLFLMGNHQPRVGAGGDSFWRRLRLLPFTRTVPPEKRVEALARTLVEAEGPGILNWIITGAVDVLTNGLTTPESVKAATDVYAQEEDALARFVADHVNLGGGEHARVNTAHMRTVYSAWCRAQGEREITPQMFGRELRARFNVDQTRANGKRFYTNLTLLDTDDLDEEQQAEHWLDR